MTHLGRGNTALSVTMSAVSTSAATFMTPLNIAFWGSLHPRTGAILRRVDLDPGEMLLTVATILGGPIVAGMVLAARWPELAERLRRPMKNFGYFLRFVGLVAGLVALPNATAFGLGYGAAKLAGLAERDRRAVAIEIGIQNSGLGLLIVFNFFDGLGGMAIVAAWWGVWHILAGLTVATFWSRRATEGSSDPVAVESV